MLLRIPDFPVHQRGLLWESASRTSNVFIAWNDAKLDIFVYHSERLTGLSVSFSRVSQTCSNPFDLKQVAVLFDLVRPQSLAATLLSYSKDQNFCHLLPPPS